MTASINNSVYIALTHFRIINDNDNVVGSEIAVLRLLAVVVDNCKRK